MLKGRLFTRSVRDWCATARASKGTRIGLRIAKWVAIVVGSLWLSYVVVANILLSTQSAKNKVNAKPQTLQVDYASAWTIIPGIVHLSGLTAFGQSTELQYKVEVDHVSVDIGLFSLLGSHIVIESVDLSGVAFLGRTTGTTSPAAPTIDAPVPLDSSQAPPVLLVNESLSRWTIDVCDLDATDGREIWIDAVHYVGPAAARGALTVTPNRTVSVQDFWLELEGGTVVVGHSPALPYLAGRIDVRLDPIDPRKLETATLRSLSANIAMAGSFADLRFVEDVGITLPAPIGGRGGKFGLDLRIDHGRVIAPGLAKVAIDGVWTNIGGMGAGGRLDLDAAVREAAGGPTARVDARIGYAEVTNPKGAVFVSIPFAAARATVTKLDLADPSNLLLVFDVRVPKALVSDASTLTSLVSDEGIQIQKGALAVKLDAEGSFPSGFLKGNASFASDQIQGVVRGVSVQGNLTGDVPFTRASSESDFAVSGSSMRLDNTALDYDDYHTRDWWGRVTIPHGMLRVSGQRMFLGNIHMDSRNLDPAITAIGALHDAPGWIHKMAGLGPYSVDASGAFGKHTRLDMLDARSPAEELTGHPEARVRLTYDDTKVPDRLRAAVTFGVRAVAIEKVGSDVRTEQRVDVNAWFDQHQAIR